jgi:hypothetical protein
MSSVGQASVWIRGMVLSVVVGTFGTPALAAELWIGGASVSITPDRPVALAGQMRTRIARNVESPVTATVLALESRDGEESLDQAVMVSCDLVAIRGGFVDAIRESLRDRLPGLDVEKIFFGATHTHTAPVMIEGRYDVDDPEVISPAEYVEFAAERIGKAITQAWTDRQPGAVGWGLGHAVVAYNRRIVYADGQAQMYGRTDRSDFRRIEGYEDHGVEVLFFWDEEERLIATAVNVACPAQVVEGRSAVNADFWHPVRETLREKYGENLVVLGWTGAAGDQAPRPMFRKEAEQRMRRLRGVTELEELSRRIVHAWEEAYEGASKEIHRDVPLMHRVRRIQLTPREITTEEYAQALERIAALADQPDNQWRLRWHQGVVDRYEQQRDGKAQPYEMELHAVRLGDVAIATNDFELFTDFGIQIKARSQAVQTFLVQLAGPGTYVPTQRAVRGGGYSAIPESNTVGPQGGQELVEASVELINSLFQED